MSDNKVARINLFLHQYDYNVIFQEFHIRHILADLKTKSRVVRYKIFRYYNIFSEELRITSISSSELRQEITGSVFDSF